MLQDNLFTVLAVAKIAFGVHLYWIVPLWIGALLMHARHILRKEKFVWSARVVARRIALLVCIGGTSAMFFISSSTPLDLSTPLDFALAGGTAILLFVTAYVFVVPLANLRYPERSPLAADNLKTRMATSRVFRGR